MLALQTEDLCFIPRTHVKVEGIVVGSRNFSAVKWKQVDHWDSLFSQPLETGKFQPSERPLP